MLKPLKHWDQIIKSAVPEPSIEYVLIVPINVYEVTQFWLSTKITTNWKLITSRWIFSKNFDNMTLTRFTRFALKIESYIKSYSLVIYLVILNQLAVDGAFGSYSKASGGRLASII